MVGAGEQETIKHAVPHKNRYFFMLLCNSEELTTLIAFFVLYVMVYNKNIVFFLFMQTWQGVFQGFLYWCINTSIRKSIKECGCLLRIQYHRKQHKRYQLPRFVFFVCSFPLSLWYRCHRP